VTVTVTCVAWAVRPGMPSVRQSEDKHQFPGALALIALDPG
jgi:hypothetical protein